MKINKDTHDKANKIKKDQLSKIRKLYNDEYVEAVKDAIAINNMEEVCQLAYDYEENLKQHGIHILLTRK